MSRWIMYRSTLAALVTSVVLLGCDVGSVTEPHGAFEPVVDQVSQTVVTDGNGKEYTLVRGRSPGTGSGSGLIGPSGGSFWVGGHQLVVPANAVDAPTIFTITVLEDGYIGAKLSAVDEATGADVGKDGFAKPVRLRLSYEYAEDVPDEGKLTMVRRNDDGTVRAVEKSVDVPNKFVLGWLNSFSLYIIAF